MTARSTVKSSTRQEQGRRAMAAMERDPATGRIRRKAGGDPAPAPAPAPAPEPQPAGGGAPAPAPFAGPSRGFRARLRRRSSS